MTKRVSGVGVSAATVVYATKERIGFLTDGGVVFWIDLDSRRDLQGIMSKEGELAWVYFAQTNSQVVSVMRHSGETFEELPKIDSVEV